jgi:hypothetical protein
MPTELQIETIPVSEMNPAPYNPRSISDEAMQGLRKSLDRFGMVEPIIWNRRTGNIVGGHQRFRLLTSGENAPTEMQVSVVDLSPTKEKALNVALNSSKIAGDFDNSLAALLEEIRVDDEELFADINLTALVDKLPEETDWAEEIGADSKGQPTCMQRTFILSNEQSEVLDEALQVARENGLHEDPDNTNKNGNALHAICVGFLSWAKK